MTAPDRGVVAMTVPIVVDDGDNEPDDLDGMNGGGAGDGDAPSAGDTPDLAALVAENQRLRAGNERNNRELRKRREVERAMHDLGIGDAEQLRARLAAAGGQAQPPPGESPAQEPSAPPADPSPQQPALDEREVDRRVQLELERRELDEQRRVEALSGKLRDSSLRAAMVEAGFTGNWDRALKVIDLDEIKIGEDGEVTGAVEAVASLKSELPEWFRSRNGSPRRSGEDVDGGSRRPPKAAPKSWADQAVARMIGGGR